MPIACPLPARSATTLFIAVLPATSHCPPSRQGRRGQVVAAGRRRVVQAQAEAVAAVNLAGAGRQAAAVVGKGM